MNGVHIIVRHPEILMSVAVFIVLIAIFGAAVLLVAYRDMLRATRFPGSDPT